MTETIEILERAKRTAQRTQERIRRDAQTRERVATLTECEQTFRAIGALR